MFIFFSFLFFLTENISDLVFRKPVQCRYTDTETGLWNSS